MDDESDDGRDTEDDSDRPTLNGIDARTDDSDAEANGDEDGSEEEDPHPIEEWRHENVVEWGGDPDGEENVRLIMSEIVDEIGGDDLLIEFPEGVYLMEEGFFHRQFENFGLRGDNAVIVVPSDFYGVGIHSNKVFSLGPSGSFRGHNVYVGGFEFDFSALEDTGRSNVSALGSYASGWAEFENLHVPVKPQRGSRMIELMAREDCEGRIHNCVVEGSPGSGIYVGPQAGTFVEITNCEASNCDDNGFYCSTGDGEVLIERCLAVNNEISNIRLGGTVRDSRVIVTDDDLDNARGYWLRNGDCTVESCYGYNDANGSREIVEVAPSAGEVLIRDSTFGSDSDQRIAVVHDRGDGDGPPVHFANCTFFGSMDNDSEAILVRREETSFDSPTFDLENDIEPIATI